MDKSSSNLVANQVTNQVSNQVGNLVNVANRLTKRDLTSQQKDIINFCSVPRSSQEIMDHIGVSNQYVNRRRHLLPLIEAGFIEMTDVESPNSPTQKYRKVRK